MDFYYGMNTDYFDPMRGVDYCNEYVCLSVRSRNAKTTRLNFTIFLCMLPVAVVRPLLMALGYGYVIYFWFYR